MFSASEFDEIQILRFNICHMINFGANKSKQTNHSKLTSIITLPRSKTINPALFGPYNTRGHIFLLYTSTCIYTRASTCIYTRASTCI